MVQEISNKEESSKFRGDLRGARMGVDIHRYNMEVMLAVGGRE